MRWTAVLVSSLLLCACPSTLARCSDGCPDATVCDDATGLCVRPEPLDAGLFDAGVPDSGSIDAGVVDAGAPDGGAESDAGLTDAGAPDAGRVVLPNQASILSGGRASSAAYRMDATISAPISVRLRAETTN